MQAGASLASLSAVLLASTHALAEPAALRYDLWLDSAVTLGAAAVVVSTQALSSELAAEPCRWCETNPVDSDARDLLRWQNHRTADRLSSVAAYAMVPVNLAGSLLVAASDDNAAANVPVDVLLAAEASMLAMVACNGAKLAFGRQRPWVNALGDSSDRQPHPDDNLSFFSGHTTLAFSLATAGGTIASMRGYRSAGWVWFSGLMLASSVAYLRVAGDMHYLTDVAAGAVVGSAIGAGVPYLLHGPVKGVRLVPAPGGLAAAGVF